MCLHQCIPCFATMSLNWQDRSVLGNYVIITCYYNLPLSYCEDQTLDNMELPDM